MTKLGSGKKVMKLSYTYVTKEEMKDSITLPSNNEREGEHTLEAILKRNYSVAKRMEILFKGYNRDAVSDAVKRGCAEQSVGSLDILDTTHMLVTGYVRRGMGLNKYRLRLVDFAQPKFNRLVKVTILSSIDSDDQVFGGEQMVVTLRMQKHLLDNKMSEMRERRYALRHLGDAYDERDAIKDAEALFNWLMSTNLFENPEPVAPVQKIHQVWEVSTFMQ